MVQVLFRVWVQGLFRVHGKGFSISGQGSGLVKG